MDLQENLQRIAKRIAHAGLASRRGAEEMIRQNRVKVNGIRITSPATLVSESDKVQVDGEELPLPGDPQLYRYHKPVGEMVTHSDPQGRPTIFEKLPAELPRLISVGRLDINSEGLILLTNNGALARHLELPKTGWLRRYRVKVHGKLNETRLQELRNGCEIEGVRYGPVHIKIEKTARTNHWLTVGLREGKNREIRKVMNVQGLQVSRLIREAFGPIQLGNLPCGALAQIPMKQMQEQLGNRSNQ